MKNNPLYFLLHNYASILPLNSIFATTEDNKHYYRIPLRPSQPSNNNLSIKEAHLSVYEKLDENNPLLGSSHITVNVYDSTDQEFRLHIFLDSKDAIAKAPEWHQREGHNIYTRKTLPTDKLMDSLIHVSRQAALPVIGTLRQAQKAVINDLKQDYVHLNKKLDALLQTMSAANYDNNAAETLETSYIAALEETQQLLKQLQYLSGSSKWQRLRTTISKALRSEQQGSFAIEEQPIIQTVPELTSSDSRDGNKTSIISEHIFQAPKKVKRTKPDLFSQFEKLSSQENSEEETLLLLNTICESLALLSIDETSTYLPKEYQQLKLIEETIDHTACELLKNLLLSAQFEKARQLRNFYSSLDLNYFIILSLQTRNSQLLKFLVQECSLPINTYSITLDNRTYSNALNYCLITHSKKNPMAECAAALISLGADPLMPDDRTGLPIAHSILCEGTKHPLYTALEQNGRQTIENKYFYYQLINSLKNLLNTPELSKNRIQSAKKALAKYELSVESVGLMPSAATIEKNLADAIANKYKSLEEPIEQLANDEDILDLQKQMIERLKIYKTEWQKSHFGRGKKFPLNEAVMKDNGEMLVASIKKSPSMNFDCELEVLKAECVQNFNIILNYLDTARRLLYTQDQLLRFPAYNRPTKRMKQLANEEQRLVATLRELEPQLPANVLKEDMDLLTGLDALTQMRDNMSNLLAQFGKFANIAAASDADKPSEVEDNIGTNGVAQLGSLLVQLGKFAKSIDSQLAPNKDQTEANECSIM